MNSTSKILIGIAVVGGFALAAKAAASEPETPTGGGSKPGGKLPTGGATKPGGGKPGAAKPPVVVKPPGEEPIGGDPAVWMPEPYDEYKFGTWTIDFTAFPSGGVRWRAWPTATNPTTEEEKDAFKIGSGMKDTEDESRLAAETFVNSMEKSAHPLPPKPTLDGAPVPAPALVRHGLRIQGDTIAVPEPANWIAWAEPFIRTRVATLDRDELARSLLAASFPEIAERGPIVLENLRVADGRTLLQLLELVDAKYLAGARQGQAWPSTSVDDPSRLERAVAELVGSQAPSATAGAWAHDGYQVIVEPFGAGRWSWQAWRRGRESDDTPPDIKGVVQAQRRAIRAAKT